MRIIRNSYILFFYIKHLHSNIKPTVTRHYKYDKICLGDFKEIGDKHPQTWILNNTLLMKTADI